MCFLLAFDIVSSPVLLFLQNRVLLRLVARLTRVVVLVVIALLVHAARTDRKFALPSLAPCDLGAPIDRGCLTLGQCQLSNPGDRAGRSGPGARYWIGDRRPAT